MSSLDPEALKDAKSIEFKVVREDWNRYIIKDEKPIPLKAKVVVSKIVKTDRYDEHGDPIYGVASQTVAVTDAPREVKGTPSRNINLATAYAKAKELEFESVEEKWNEYEVKDGTVVRVKLVVSGVQKTEYFVPDGDPLYNIQNDAVVKYIVPPDLKRKAGS